MLKRLPIPLLISALGPLVLPPVLLALGLTMTSATEVVIFAVACMALNILVGYTGLVSFGLGAFPIDSITKLLRRYTNKSFGGAEDAQETDELVKLARKHKRIAQVGHLERFNPAVRATLPILTQPMFFEVHRLSVFTPRSLDVDVVLDLMIHDLDIVLAFAKSPVKEVRAVGLPILSGKVDIANVRLEFESGYDWHSVSNVQSGNQQFGATGQVDIANVRLEFESGCIANFTASRVSTERVRKIRFFQPRQYVSLDYGRQEVLVFTVGADGESPATPSVNPQIGVTKPPVAAEEPLHGELKSFLHAVHERSTPVVPLEDGRRALALALEIVTAIREHGKKVGLASIAKP